MKKEESGLEPDPLYEDKDKSSIWISKVRECRSPEHDPPGHLVIPQGQQYRHVCPHCGEVRIIRNSIIFML